MPDYNEKGQLLYDAVVEKLKMSSSLYILLDKSTGLPYIIEGTVDVYSEEILAKHALHFYENQYHKSLILKEVPKKNSGLPGRISCLHGFTTLEWKNFLLITAPISC